MSDYMKIKDGYSWQEERPVRKENYFRGRQWRRNDRWLNHKISDFETVPRTNNDEELNPTGTGRVPELGAQGGMCHCSDAGIIPRYGKTQCIPCEICVNKHGRCSADNIPIYTFE
jgi:hypothetical protein